MFVLFDLVVLADLKGIPPPTSANHRSDPMSTEGEALTAGNGGSPVSGLGTR
jgi:hypothetical protein